MTGLTDFRLPLDEPIFRAVNGLGWTWLDALFAAASSRTFGVLATVAMVAWLIAHLRKRALPALLALAAAISVTDRIGSVLIKPGIGRMRPCFAMPSQARVLVEVGNVGSMPSLHSANAFAVATLVALLVPRAGYVTFPLAALIALSRVGVGVHWPSDILVGALYGSLIGGAMALICRRFSRSPARSLASS